MSQTTLRFRRSIELALVACLAAVFTGCGGGGAMQRIESSSNLKELARAVIKYHDDKQEWPEKLADLESMVGESDAMGVIGDGKDYATLVRNPLTGDDPGYEYVTPPAEPEGLSKTIVLYQLRDGKRDETLPVAYLDGSVRPMGGGE
jgi:hypothetical protein